MKTTYNGNLFWLKYTKKCRLQVFLQMKMIKSKSIYKVYLPYSLILLDIVPYLEQIMLFLWSISFQAIEWLKI